MNDYIDLGIDLDTGQPVREPVASFFESNSIALGRTRSGKTTRLGFRLFRQVPNLDAALVVFEGGETPFVYYALSELAKSSGREFRVLFDHPRFESHRLDPFHQYRGIRAWDIDVGNQLFNTAGIHYTRAYGPSWYGLTSLRQGVRSSGVVIRQGAPISFPSLLEKMEALVRDARDAEQIRFSLEMASLHESIAAPDDGGPDFIRWSEVAEKKQIVLVSYEASRPSSSFFAAAVHQSLVSYAHLGTALGRKKTWFIIIADEWWSLLSLTYAQSLATELKHFLSHHLLNQSRSQLDLVDERLAEIVLNEANFEFHFTPDVKSQEHIQSFSKETEGSLRTRTISSTGFALSDREYRERKLDVNQLLEISSTPGAAILVRKVPDGFKEPIKLYLDHEISEEVFRHWSSLPLPLRPEPVTPPAPPPTGWRHAPQDDAWRARGEAIRAVYERRRAWRLGQ
jgi:hypothetical protein